MSNAHPSTGLQNSYKYHINYIYSTINNNILDINLTTIEQIQECFITFNGSFN